MENNYLLGARYSRAGLRDALYERWGNAFKFFDGRGRHGPKRGLYVASRLPNSYDAPSLWQQPRGRQGKINRIIDLVAHVGEEGALPAGSGSSSLTQTRGNGGRQVDRLFFQGAKEARGRRPAPNRFWKSRIRVGRGGGRFWYPLAGEREAVVFLQ